MQFTSAELSNQLKAADISISWYGRGRVLVNIFVECLRSSVIYKEVYIKEYQSVLEGCHGFSNWRLT
jgi:hypothetical protein